VALDVSANATSIRLHRAKKKLGQLLNADTSRDHS
jgi:DNA-directed RNA polymerase specialized sigma24 family protein